jgi:hypothetical protein
MKVIVQKSVLALQYELSSQSEKINYVEEWKD